jgi:hypothetical protein
MKKYFLGLIAVILIVAASAFVTSKKNAPPTLYHWYTVDASGVVVSGSDAFGGTQETQAFADAHPPCPTGTASDCIRGFVSVPTFPTMATGDAIPLKKP